MPFVDTARKQILAKLPTGTTSPTLVQHLADLFNAAETRFVLRYTDDADRTAKIGTPENGMITVLTTPGVVEVRLAGVWKRLYPTSYEGTAIPAPSLGVDGDTYFRHL